VGHTNDDGVEAMSGAKGSVECVCWVVVTSHEWGVRIEWNKGGVHEHRCPPEDREAVYLAARDEVERLLRERYGV